MTTTVFQSWADIVIMLVLVIVYIVTFIAQRNSIKAHKDTIASQKETIEALKVANAVSSENTKALGEHVKTYKEIVKIDDVANYVNMQVALRLEDSVNNVIEDIKDKVLYGELFDKAVEALSDELRKMHASNFFFILYIINHNNMSTDKIKEMVDTFFPHSLWLYDIIIEKLPSFPYGRKTNHVFPPDSEKSLTQ